MKDNHTTFEEELNYIRGLLLLNSYATTKDVDEDMNELKSLIAQKIEGLKMKEIVIEYLPGDGAEQALMRFIRNIVEDNNTKIDKLLEELK